jgi:heat-inducible transcriptional repressor
MLSLAEPVSQDQLSATAANLSLLGQSLDIEQISALAPQMDVLGQDVIKVILEDMHHSGDILGGEVYRDGLTNVLSEPEFAEVDVARRALRILEERSLLEDLLTRTVLTTNMDGVQVLIGGESDCSVVLARYGAPGYATGAIGVLGPIRMAYGRTISTVRFVAGLLSDLVIDLHTE